MRTHSQDNPRHTLAQQLACRIVEEMRKSRLKVKPHYHTQERRQPLIKVMISHTSRAAACHSGKSSRHWFAHSPLECLARRYTRTNELQHPKTFVMGLSRSGPTHPLLRPGPNKPKNVTDTQQLLGKHMNRPRVDRGHPLRRRWWSQISTLPT